MELTRHGRTYYLAHFNARRASQLGRVAIGNPDAELGQSVLELLADIARIITPGQACGPAKRWRVVALGQHPGRQYRHILRQDRIKPVANRHLIGLHPPDRAACQPPPRDMKRPASHPRQRPPPR